MNLDLPITSPNVAPKENKCVDTCAAALVGLGVLCGMVIYLSTLFFLIPGVIFAAEEFGDIPACAEPYKAWIITILLLLLSSGQQVRKANHNDKKTKRKEIACAMMFCSILTGLVAGLGWTKVLHYPPATCDTSDMSQIVTWTTWIIYYYIALTIILAVTGLISYCHGSD